MGFEAPRTTTRLVFDDPAYNGLEVVCRSVSIGVLFEFARIQDDVGLAQSEAIMRRFGDEVLESWNLVEDGEPVPATAEGVLRQEVSFAMSLIKTWIEAVSSPPAPLGVPSQDGGMSAAASIPMVSLSVSPVS